MKSPKILISIFLLTICQSSFSQQLNKIEREYFILGTLSDYMGRNLDPREKNLLDRYYPLEGPLVIMVDSLLKIDYDPSDYKAERYFKSNGKPSSFKIFSDVISKKFNSYYAFEPSGSLTSVEGDTIYRGILKNTVFKTDDEKLAFLAGTYVRFGRPNDTTYEISIANSASKALICDRLLKEFNSKPTYSVWKNYIPVGYHIYFHPNEELKAYLQRYMYLRKRLEK